MINRSICKGCSHQWAPTSGYQCVEYVVKDCWIAHYDEVKRNETAKLEDDYSYLEGVFNESQKQ